MKRLLIYLAFAGLLTCSCAKKIETPVNESAKLFFDSWMHVHYPDLEPTALGAYVLEDIPGTGDDLGTAEDYPYVRVYSTRSNLDGTVVSTNRKSMAQQVGDYDSTYYYGPEVMLRASAYAGIEEALETMKVGGRRKIIVPGWLMTYSRYSTAEEYLANVTGTNSICDIEVVEAISDIEDWEIDSLGDYIERTYPISRKDSVKFGCYYRQTGQPSSLESLPNDTTIYINYTGRLLDGRVFDTTIRDTARRYGLFSSSTEYGPVSIQYNADDYSKITMGDSESTLIDGFSYTISRMKSHEKGVGIFYSGLGYGSSGSGNAIPGYSPLIFEIEIVDKPED